MWQSLDAIVANWTGYHPVIFSLMRSLEKVLLNDGEHFLFLYK